MVLVPLVRAPGRVGSMDTEVGVEVELSGLVVVEDEVEEEEEVDGISVFAKSINSSSSSSSASSSTTKIPSGRVSFSGISA